MFQLIILPSMVTEIKLFIIIIISSLSLASRFAIKTSRAGVRCIIYNDRYSVSKTEQYLHCVIRCMQNGCHFFNYNVVEKFCQLGAESCDSLVFNNQYNLTSFSPPMTMCLKWIPHAGSDTSHMIQSSTCHIEQQYAKCYVGRLITGVHILPGKFEVGGALYTILNGETYIHGGQVEVLTVGAGCQVGWIPYVAGNMIPTRAVAGGFMASGTRFSLFVIRGQAIGYTLFGYYDPNLQKGYVQINGVHALTEMEMLVEV